MWPLAEKPLDDEPSDAIGVPYHQPGPKSP